jgi:hypothetical protein
MAREIIKYAIWCDTDSKWEYVLLEDGDPTPTTCPTDTGHTVDTDKVNIVETINYEITDVSGKEMIHQTSKPLGALYFFTGEGDDVTDVNKRGGGTRATYKHEIGDSTMNVTYLDFNTINNRTWLHEGYLQWQGCDFDHLCLDVVPIVTTTQAGTDTNYNSYGGIIIPAEGDGTLDVTADLTDPQGGLVYMPTDELGITPPAYWNADWNDTTNEFENIAPAPAGNGRYNMFPAEVIFERFVNNMVLLGDGFIKFQTSDISEIGHGMRAKVVAETYGTDHDWKMAVTLVLNRLETS